MSEVLQNNPLIKELKPYLKAMEQKAQNSSMGNIHTYVNEVYGSFIDTLSGGKKHARNVLQHVVEKVLDSGLARPHQFNDSNEETPPIAEAVPMLSRQAMLYQVKRKSGLERDEQGKFKIGPDKQIHALTLDLERFRKADEAGAGDYDLNIVAAAIKSAEAEIVKLGIEASDIVVGRYGGDEFYVFIVGNTANRYSQKINYIKDIIRKNVTAAKGYFGKNEASVHFAIKHNTVEAIEAPSDTEENREKRQKFLEFIDKNSILDPEQLEKEVAYERENPLTDAEQNIKKRKSIYPDEIEILPDGEAKVTAQIEYLICSNQDLKIPYWYALAKDKKDNKNNPNSFDKQKNVRALLDFYQEILIDPLLNEIALGRFNIKDHLEKKEFSRIFVYEAKLKEINDHLSWTYADERVVKKLWEENFKSVFREEIKTGVLTVGRIGGSIIMMQKEGATLSEETEKKLRKFKDSNFGSRYDNTRGVIDHEIGFAEIDTTGQSPEDVFQKIFTEPTKDWLNKTFNRIVNDGEEYKRFIQLLGNNEDDPEHTLTFLSARYFTGNRWKNRGITAREVLTSLLKSYRKDEVTDIIERIGEISNQLDLIAETKSQDS